MRFLGLITELYLPATSHCFCVAVINKIDNGSCYVHTTLGSSAPKLYLTASIIL